MSHDHSKGPIFIIIMGLPIFFIWILQIDTKWLTFVIISEFCYQSQTPRVELTLGPRFYKFTTFVQAVKILYDVIKSDYKMTYSDVIGQIRFQIQTHGAHTKFGPD